ncbi:MAG TPA: ABC transporter substrate-binding protein [Verrucomicrobiae bacterium]|nr:ABC transporter substrate-binding protein [Verrucomicrobiae bacterium]
MEGENLVIEYRFAEGKHDRLPALAAELIALKVDVIAAGPTPPALAAKRATTEIPIVMTAVGDPVRNGLVASLARPGGNVTGVSFDVGLEVFTKGLELLKESIPMLRRVAVLSNSSNPSQAVSVRDVTAAARSLGLQIKVVDAPTVSALDGVFAAMAKDRSEALLVLTDPLFLIHRERIGSLALRHRLPSMHAVKESVEAGGFMSYGPSLVGAYRRVAVYVDKILKGARPADLPVEQPTTFEMAINLKTAKALGVTIPRSLLGRADRIIE